MTRYRNIAVLDVGKTNAKLALVDLETMAESAVVTLPNHVIPGPPWPHFDVEGLWDFALGGLTRFGADTGVDGISVTTHGATIALLDDAGGLAAPILDYEFLGPNEDAEAYGQLRPDFTETGSPRLPAGLNAGAQLYWQSKRDPGLLARTAAIVAYPQYWGARLTGIVASDVSSLGCHTDLWNPAAHTFSGLADTLGIRDKLAPARPATDMLGPILPEVAKRTGLRPDTPVACGIHDSNASLLPHILSRKPPFTVVSTGTWVIVMAVGGRSLALDPTRDTLMNVSAFGDPVPSARFMGGREFEIAMEGQPSDGSSSRAEDQVAPEYFLLPAVEPASGPFQGRAARWHPAEPAKGSVARANSVSFYLAMMTAECISLCGGEGAVVVEGPFTSNAAFLEMLATATASRVMSTSSATGTSLGAALLFDSGRARTDPEVSVVDPKPKLKDYAARWRSLVATAQDH